MNKNINVSSMKSEKSSENNVNFELVIDALIRRKYWLIGGGAIGLLLSGFNLLNSKPVYQGEFQIVLTQNQSNGALASLLRSDNTMSLVAGLTGSGGTSIDTEVQILNSPSVLMPVFEAVKAYKSPDQAKKMRFQRWARSSVTAEVEKGTTVLNVKFRDQNKSKVLPITELISKAYQKYSFRGRTEEINNVIEYLEKQINILKPQVKISSRKALDYGYANGLGVLDGLPISATVSGINMPDAGFGPGSKISGSGNSIESARTGAQQKVLALEVQIKEASQAGAGSLYFASQLGSLTDKSSTFDQLTSLESILAEYRSRFKESDPLITRLERERRSLIGYINNQTIALLKGELDLAKATLQSLDRPKEVIAMHRELTQTALRNESTLVSLENQLFSIKLEQARAASPWELITTPTMLDNPVSPRKGRTLALGLIAGSLLGSIAALIIDKRSNLVFSTEEINQYVPGPLLERLPCMKYFGENSWSTKIKLLADGPLRNKGSLALIPVGNMESFPYKKFFNELRKALPLDQELLSSTDLLATRRSNSQLIVTSQGAATREQLRELNEQLDLQGAPVTGWVLLDKNLKPTKDRSGIV